jgi:exodeoxyribonuclease VII small subunit
VATRQSLQREEGAELPQKEQSSASRSRSDPPPGDRQYSDVVNRLEEVVKKLEGGELSLEDSLEEFEKGIQLVKRGEELLQQAERRVQELLEHKGGDRTVPLEANRGVPSKAAPAATDDDDIPF